MKTNEINIRDPFVLLENGTYYLYGTRGATCWGPATGFDVYTGTDLENWEGPFPCFENDGTFWADRNYWAPEVHPWQGTYFMFASFKSETRRRGTAVLRANSPAGPFVPWSDGPVTPADRECLDGTFYTDRQGNPWMVFCHEWVQVGDGEILAMPLTEDLKAAAGEPRLLFRASDAPWTKEMGHSSGIKGRVTDGPFLWRSGKDQLLCLWSSFSEDGYTQGLAESDNGEITGHFRQLAPLFREDGGHGMFFRTKDGQTMLALHRPNRHLEEHPVFIPVEYRNASYLPKNRNSSKEAVRMLKVAFYDAKAYDKPAFEHYGGLHNMQFRFLETKLNEDTAELAKGCNAVCVFVNDNVNSAVIDRLYEYGVKLIALRSAGYNNVDVKHAYGKIHVVHVPAYSPYAVAEHAIALLLTIVRRIHKAYNRTREFNFSLSGLTGFDFHGKTVGVIGTGKIGRIFIDICRGFGMHVLAYDRFPAKDSGIEYVTLDELFEKSDIISLHCPLTDETRHMIDAAAIGKMKKGVVIVNTSRGGLIDAEALLEGIKARKIGAACLDVYEEEADVFFEDRSGHIMNDDLLARLISMPNVIVTSHQAFLTEEALGNIAETTVNNILSCFNNDGICDNELCYRCGHIEQCKKERKQKCF